ncbi:MAG TPA: RNA polymerase sigma factor [Gemmatimonadales bacterium]|jgi:RNA polymerase sigma-70 factor (ECF subfamily)
MTALVEESDRDLMRELQGGKTIALEALFVRHHPRVHSFLARLTGDRDAADDLVQEVFLRILKYRSRFDPSRDFLAWLFRIARNTAATHFRRQKPTSPEPDDWADDNPSALDTLIVGEDRQQLDRALAALPFAHREVLLLRGMEGLSHRDLALALGCSEGAARVRVHRALRALKREWATLAGDTR